MMESTDFLATSPNLGVSHYLCLRRIPKSLISLAIILIQPIGQQQTKGAIGANVL
jgi:hypothetical protein